MNTEDNETAQANVSETLRETKTERAIDAANFKVRKMDNCERKVNYTLLGENGEADALETVYTV